MVMQDCNPSTQQATAGHSPAQGHPALYSVTLPQKEKKKKKRNQKNKSHTFVPQTQRLVRASRSPQEISEMTFSHAC
jgi:hypothetical protein